jgi:hypothetical protein
MYTHAILSGQHMLANTRHTLLLFLGVLRLGVAPLLSNLLGFGTIVALFLDSIGSLLLLGVLAIAFLLRALLAFLHDSPEIALASLTPLLQRLQDIVPDLVVQCVEFAGGGRVVRFERGRMRLVYERIQVQVGGDEVCGRRVKVWRLSGQCGHRLAGTGWSRVGGSVGCSVCQSGHGRAVSAGRATIACLAGAFLGCRRHDRSCRWIRGVVCKGLSSRKQHPGRERVALVSAIPNVVLLSFSSGNPRGIERNYEYGPWRCQFLMVMLTFEHSPGRSKNTIHAILARTID